MQALRIKKTFSVPRIITEPAIQCRRANRGVPRPVCAAGHGARGLCHGHCADLGPGDCAAAPEPVWGLARTARSHGGIGLNAFFAALFVDSALLFRQAAQAQPAPPTTY